MDTKILLGELREFKRQTISELQEIKKDVKAQGYFKAKVTGAAMFASFLGTLIIDFIRK